MMAVRHPNARIDRRNAMAIGRFSMGMRALFSASPLKFPEARDSNRSMRKTPLSVDLCWLFWTAHAIHVWRWNSWIYYRHINFQLNNAFQRIHKSTLFDEAQYVHQHELHSTQPILFFNVNGALFRIRVARAQDSRPAPHDYADH